MPDFTAVTWTVKPGSEERVAELFAGYKRPDSFVMEDAEGNVTGKLIATAVFMKDNRVVRVIEYEGSLPALMRHMAAQDTVRELEEQLAEFLEQPRDTSSPTAFRDFFIANSMRCVAARWSDR
ncbi:MULTISPECIES: SchA/CurD-like domain-containing protein [Streptomyces]|uniref:SchA/CurD n=1 Tax=Streptomyces lycii TaxID=2654337 RepID=A0ABQ7FHQ0_9ACTN|nr:MULTISPECIES: SchA/CurD-like domain-containing protein [Streptomyces]KAF4407473.1 SchA/CurD [Streptomyces lycii]